MPEVSTQTQLNDINRKLDLVIEHVIQQRRKQQVLEDLVEDLTIIGKDVVQNSVIQLDKAGIEIDSEAVLSLLFKLIRNIDVINETFETLISFNDLIKDMGPIVRQIGLDSIQKLNELDEKGYISFIKEIYKITDNVVANFTAEDVRLLSRNIVAILNTIKNLTQPGILSAANNAVSVYKNLDTTTIPEYSLWKAFKELRSPEMRKALGFMITFLKNMAKESTK